MNKWGRRASYKLKNIIRDAGIDSRQMELFQRSHPLTMKLILKRLSKDNDEAVAKIAKSLIPIEPGKEKEPPGLE